MTDLAHQKQIARLTQALNELLGFAERNLKRAEQYSKLTREHVKANRGGITQTDFNDLLKAEAREHEASRFFCVVRDRVAEALR